MTNLPSIESVRTEVQGLAAGRRKILFFTVLARAFFALAVVVAATAWFVSTPTTLWLALGAAGVALVFAVAAALVMRVDEVAVAKRYDDVVGTKDLLSSSLELQGDEHAGDAERAALGSAFVAAVREDAQAATGRAGTKELYPTAMPRELRWLPLPILVCVAAIVFEWSTTPPPPPPPPPHVVAALDTTAKWLEDLANKHDPEINDLPSELLEALKNAALALRSPDVDKRKALAELARLATQLDREKENFEARKMQLEKNVAKLARGEDAKDIQRDMDAGRYREAANKVKKKITELEKKIREAIEKKLGKVEIDKMRDRLAKLKELLAELDQLDALSNNLGFLVETLEDLERFEGELGELGEFDGEMFDEAKLGRFRPPQNAQQQDPNNPGQLLVMPSNEAGEGHVKKLFDTAKRALSDGDQHEAKLREGKGKSSYGQVQTANDGSKSRQAYRDALLAGKRAADDAIYRQNIPVGYRNYIRRYFEALQPDDGAASSSGSGEGR